MTPEQFAKRTPEQRAPTLLVMAALLEASPAKVVTDHGAFRLARAALEAFLEEDVTLESARQIMRAAFPRPDALELADDVLARLRRMAYNVDKPTNDGAIAMQGAVAALDAIGRSDAARLLFRP